MSEILPAMSSVLLMDSRYLDGEFNYDGALWVTRLKQRKIGGKQYLIGHVENGYWELRIQDGFAWCTGAKHKKRPTEKFVQIMVEPGIGGGYNEIIWRAREAHKTGLTLVKYDPKIDG